MASPTETISKFHAGLEHFIKPREHVNYIRRILALHLASHAGPAVPPLSLTDSTREVSASTELQGLQNEYVEALQENSAARRKFDEALQASRSREDPQSTPPPTGSEVLAQRLMLLKLRQKRECLLAVQRSFDRIAEKPAAASGRLSAEEICFGGAALPSVPRAVVNSFVAEQSSGQPDLQSRVSQLEKMVLRSKLLLKQEERLLAEARARCRSRLDVASNGAKLEALNTARNELIGWIEVELGNASADDSEGMVKKPDVGQAVESADDQATITTQLGQIRGKYAKYLAARKALLALISHQLQPSIPLPRRQSSSRERADDTDPEPVDYLLTPYVEALLSVFRHQKAVITHKSHINTILNEQNKEACQVLDHLAEESQLLPLYPMKDSLQQKSGLGNEVTSTSSHRLDMANRVRPWMFAADSAKIATLEAVAETIEGGQAALENCMKTLRDIDQLLGQDTEAAAHDDDVVEPLEDDVWLSSEGTEAAGSRKHSEEMTGRRQQKGDPWSRLHGNLGVMGQEDVA